MKSEKEPMPLGELPGYIDSVRENGQSDVPVVQMGMIVEPRSSYGLFGIYAAAACLFLMAGGMLTYAVVATEEITVVAADESVSPQAIADMVSEGGGRAISVKQNGDRSYQVKVLTLRNMGSFLEGLRRNKGLSRVDPKE